MAGNTFFSFDYDDVRAANIVRNSNVVRKPGARMAFRDHSLYEKIKPRDAAIEKAITDGLKNTTVTAIINGGETYRSRWVKYEIAKSLERGNGFIVIDVDGVGLEPQPHRGPNPLDFMGGTPEPATSLLGGRKFALWERAYAGADWTRYQKVEKIYEGRNGYRQGMFEGKGFILSTFFQRRHHWNDIQTKFEDHLSLAADDVGRHTATGVRWI
jgi:hypothetical protein